MSLYARWCLPFFNGQGYFLKHDLSGSLIEQQTTSIITIDQFENARFNSNGFQNLANTWPSLRDSNSVIKKAIASTVAVIHYMHRWRDRGEFQSKYSMARGTSSIVQKVIDYSNRHRIRIDTLRMENCSLQSIENLTRKIGGKVEL